MLGFWRMQPTCLIQWIKRTVQEHWQRRFRYSIIFTRTCMGETFVFGFLMKTGSQASSRIRMDILRVGHSLVPSQKSLLCPWLRILKCTWSRCTSRSAKNVEHRRDTRRITPVSTHLNKRVLLTMSHGSHLSNIHLHFLICVSVLVQNVVLHWTNWRIRSASQQTALTPIHFSMWRSGNSSIR